MTITLELPFYSPYSGGISHTIALAQELKKKYDVHIRFQRETPDKFNLDIPFSIGLPDHTFPASDVVITYSDNPYTNLLTELPQVKKVLIYMLSYGMCIEREHRNILNPKLTVMSSTLRTKKLIESEGITCHNVGFGRITPDFSFPNIERKKYAAILYHPSLDKRYPLGVDVCNELYKQGLINGVLTFGVECGYGSAPKPNCLVKHYPNATCLQVEEIFSECSVFVMPSISEGLNLAPKESTLCGCPAVICDGAIGELFINGITCLIAEKDNREELIFAAKTILTQSSYAECFKTNLIEKLKVYTWDRMIANTEKLF